MSSPTAAATIDTSSRFGWQVLTLLVSSALAIGVSYGTTSTKLAGVEERAVDAASTARQASSSVQQLEHRVTGAERGVADLTTSTRGLDAARQDHALRIQRLEDTVVRTDKTLGRIEDKLDALGPRVQPQPVIHRTGH